MKITKTEFDKLYDPHVTKREYDDIIAKIDERFSEILHALAPSLKTKGWFDYGNCNYDSEKSGGYFDPMHYKEEIECGGECYHLPEPYEDEGRIPTRWLWEDFEDEVKQEKQKAKEQKEAEELQKIQQLKQQKQKKIEMRQQIMAKLTKEELKFVSFK